MSKLLELFLCLKSKQQEGFFAFLSLPYISKSNQLKEVLQFVVDFYNSGASLVELKEATFQHFNPDSDTDPAKWMSNKNHELVKRLKQYMATLSLLENPAQTSIEYLRFLGKSSKDSKVFFQAVKQSGNDLKKNDKPIEEQYIKVHQLHHMLYFHPQTEKFSKNKTALPDAINHLDLYYHIKKVKYECEFLARRSLMDAPSNSGTNILESVKWLESYFDNNFPVLVYQLLLILKAYQDLSNVDEPYEKLYNSFFEVQQELSQEDRLMVFQYLKNLTIRRFANKEIEFSKLEALYSLGVQIGIFAFDSISEASFFNFIMISAESGKFKEAYDFIEEVLPQIPRNRQSQMRRMGRAILLFKQEKHAKALEEIQYLKFDTVRIAEYGYPIILRALFHEYQNGKRTEPEAKGLQARIYSFKRYIQNISYWNQNNKLQYINFLELLNELFLYLKSNKNNPQKLKVLKSSIDQCKPLFARKWLMSKVDELIE